MVSKELLIILTAASPILELRGAIPLGLSLGESTAKVLSLAIVGNLLPVVPLLLLLQPVSSCLRHLRLWRRFFDWLFERTKRKAGLIEKYEVLGLVLFVAIPLPVTGAWTGCVAATLFKIRFRYAFVAILLGISIAAIIVTTLSQLGIIVWNSL